MKRSLALQVLRNIPVAAVAIVLAYFSAGAAILHLRLDHLLWPPTTGSAEMLPPATLSSRGVGASGAIARRVGPQTGHCVVFFPGRHGGFTRYARDLFPSLNAAGLTVWAISYAGQDGAGGASTRTTVFPDVERILRSIEAQCPRSRTAFLGRSLGATVATVVASRWHPSGLVLEGAGLSLEAAVRRELAQHWYLRPLGILPVASLIGTDFPLEEYLRRYGPSRTVIFEGERDDMAPVSDLLHLVRLGVRLEVVPRATHTNAYQIAGPALPDSVARLSAGDAVEYDVSKPGGAWP